MDYLRMLFDALADAVFPPRDGERAVREARPDALRALVAPMLVERCAPAATALLSFRTPLVRACVHEAKYRGNTKAQRMLGAVLGDYLQEWSSDEGALEDASTRVVIIPIPLSDARRKERGYNQCEEVTKCALADLARSSSPAYVLDTTLLTRPHDTEHQTRLSRLLRRQNMADAFAASRTADSHALYIVLDDVVTTGATFQAAIDALRAAGAQRIVPLALAH